MIERIRTYFKRRKIVKILTQKLTELQETHPGQYEQLAEDWLSGKIDGVEGLFQAIEEYKNF